MTCFAQQTVHFPCVFTTCGVHFSFSGLHSVCGIFIVLKNSSTIYLSSHAPALTSSDTAATYCPFHTFSSPSTSSVLMMSSTFIEVLALMSLMLHVHFVSFRIFMIMYVQ